MSRSRAPLAIAAAAVGGIGYYLYSAGGNPKAAEKKFEGSFPALLTTNHHIAFLRANQKQHLTWTLPASR